MASPSTSRLDLTVWLPFAGAAVVALLALMFASIGNPFSAGATVMTLAETTVRAGLPAAAYLLAGIGLGRFFATLYRGSRNALAMQMALGLSGMLTVSHLLGALGLLGGGVGRVVAGGVIVVGLAMLGEQIVMAHRVNRQESRRPMNWGWVYALLGAPGLALMLVAASSPPGWLWESEGRGYDALSYHLQLPQEWIAMGRVAPVEHNVYSFLPSYMEAAFYHMGVVMGGRGGLIAGEGFGVLMAQWMHAGVAVLAAVLVGWLVMGLASESKNGGEEEKNEKGEERTGASGVVAGLLAGVLFLSIPWVIVTGSLAYNDLGVVMLLAAALMASADRDVPAVRRGIIVGLLVGVACGIKPTALAFAGVPAGIALLAWSRPREWAVLAAAGSAAGLAMLAPWLVRNGVCAGNPVFPFAASVLGYGHWDAEQATRYAAAHTFDGGLLDRLKMLVMVDADDPAGARHRGMLHPQWSVFFLVVAAAGAAAVASARTRAIGLVLCAMLIAQVLVWLFATHVQSRFLLPLLVPGAALFGIVVADRMPRARLIAGGATAIVAVAAVTSVILFAREPRIEGAGPNAMLVAGPMARSGELFRREFARATPRERAAFLEGAGPEAFVNLGLPEGSRVYLLGDATPLYFTIPVVYATTWDRSMLAQAMRMYPDDERWAGQLRAAGVTHVLVNYAEIARLGRSGFLDPMLSIDGVEKFMESSARPVQVWPEVGVVLYELQEGRIGMVQDDMDGSHARGGCCVAPSGIRPLRGALPGADAPGYILSPLRGWGWSDRETFLREVAL